MHNYDEIAFREKLQWVDGEPIRHPAFPYSCIIACRRAMEDLLCWWSILAGEVVWYYENKEDSLPQASHGQ